METKHSSLIKNIISLSAITVFICSNGYALSSQLSQSSKQKQPLENIVTVEGKIVFQSNRDGASSEIWLLENGNLKKLHSSAEADKKLSNSIPYILKSSISGLHEPKWSPDGARILCQSSEGFSVLDDKGTVVDVMQLKGTQASWAPQSNSIYFTGLDVNPDGGGSYNIFKYDLSDKTETRITNLSSLPGKRLILSFSISPDEQNVIYVTFGDEGTGISVWMTDMKGSEPQLLIEYAKDAKWSPDGKKIVYASYLLPSKEKISKHEEIMLYDVETKQVTRLTHNPYEDRYPSFSPDGKQIVFKSARHIMAIHGAELFVINIDGTNERQITPSKPNPKYPNDPMRGWATDEAPDWVR